MLNPTVKDCCPSCGLEREVSIYKLGRVCKSCHNFAASKRGSDSNLFKHGMYRSPLFSSWVSMRQRCQNPRNHAFADYGGRGIKVCERWDDFSKFLEDIGDRPSPLHSLDRIDNNGDYEPSNCKWSTKKEQANNRRHKRTWKWELHQEAWA